MAAPVSLFFFFFFLCAVTTIRASVHKYPKNDRFVLQGNAFVYFAGSEGLYASTSHSSNSGVANGRSYIRFDSSLVFHLPKAPRNTSLIRAIVFDIADRDKLGGSLYGGQVDLCCTPDMRREVGCTVGDIIYRHSSPGWPQVIDVPMSGNQVEMPFREVPINKTAMYILFFVHCDPQLDGLTLSGRTVWKNPSGYLPGRMTPLVTFFACMAAVYLVLGLAWLVQYVRFWRDILQVQNYITLIIALGMLEMSTWYFDYVNFNTTGTRPLGITFWAVTLGSLRRTLSRLLILVVSMGYGVVQPTLGGLTAKVLVLGGSFFLASEALDVVEHVGRVDEISQNVKVLLVLPVAVLDSFFILWIFTSLSRTLEKLQVKRQAAKLELYRKFTNALAVTVLIAAAWIGYELYFKATDTYGEHWQRAWIISAFWNVLAFVILCVICALWAPSQNSKRYAYSEDAVEDEEAIPLTSKLTSIVVDSGDSLKPERKEKKMAKMDVFRLEEDNQEEDEELDVERGRLQEQDKRE